MPISPQGYVLGGAPLSTNPFWDETETEQVEEQVEEEIHSTKAVSPQGYNLGGDPKNINPFWGEDEQTNWTIEAEATVDSTSGSPSVNVETETDSTLKVKTFTFEFSGLKGADGNNGVGIQSITKTGTSGLVDTYTILFTNGKSTTFTVTNGEKGDPGIGIQGDPGNGISDIEKTSTQGLVDTYTISFTDGTSTTFTVTNGAPGQSGSDGVGITSIAKTSTSGLVDTYTITFTNGTTTTFTVTNGTSGTDGISPEVTIAVITGGHRVTITDKDHPTGQDFDVLDGTAGADGVTPVISATASVGTGTGTPSVNVTKSGTDAAPSFAFAFDNLKGANGQGVPTGGTAGQVLTKVDGTDYNAQWTTPQSGGGNPIIRVANAATYFSTIRNNANTSSNYFPLQISRLAASAFGTGDSSAVRSNYSYDKDGSALSQSIGSGTNFSGYFFNIQKPWLNGSKYCSRAYGKFYITYDGVEYSYQGVMLIYWWGTDKFGVVPFGALWTSGHVLHGDCSMYTGIDRFFSVQASNVTDFEGYYTVGERV